MIRITKYLSQTQSKATNRSELRFDKTELDDKTMSTSWITLEFGAPYKYQLSESDSKF